MSWRIIIDCDGPVPTVRIETVPTATAPTPTPPHPTSSTVPVPPVDNSPFAWPTDGPMYQPRDGDRYFVLDHTPGSLGSTFYAAEAGAGNPLIMSHRNAGTIDAGGRTVPGGGYPDGKDVGGYRLWVPATAPPSKIRDALRLGHL